MASIRSRYKPKPKKSPLKIALKVILAIVVFSVIVGLFYGFAVAIGMIDMTDDLNIDRLQLSYSSFVYYTDPVTGEEVEYERLYDNENREWTDLMDIPDHVQKAAVAIEDERFYKHRGFDIKSTAKATYQYFVKKSTSRGASTITQQLIKNLTGDSDKTPIRKVQEIFRAVNLERKMTKDQILEMYLNTIYLSQGCSGIGSAADFYFDKDVKDLTLAEGACLIGITQYPSYYDPLVNPENNKEKQKLVLSKMLELGYISQAEYNKAVAEELEFKNVDGGRDNSQQSYFVDEIIEQVLNDLQEELGYSEAVAIKTLYSGGLKIYSTLDPDVQSVMDEVYADDSAFLKTNTDVQPQSSMVIMDPYTGQVKGLVGGRGVKEGKRTLNRATQSIRQTGSAIKPISVYGPAIEKNLISAGSVYEDKKITYGRWSPKNVYNGYKGKVTVRYAVEISINTVAVQILDKMGVDTSYDFLTNKLNFSTLNENDKTLGGLALGGLTTGMTNLELTAAYASFANAGVYNKPIFYTKILDNSGKVLLDNTGKHNQAFSDQTATIMLNILKGVVDSGTGTTAKFSGKYDIAGKTGSTDENKDKWFVGITPYYVGSVWYGFDTPRALSLGGNNPAVPVWRKVMQQIHEKKNLPEKHFEIAKGVVKASYCMDTGLLPSKYCIENGRVRTDYFKSNTVPSKYCSGPHGGGTTDEDENDPKASKNPAASPGASGTPAPGSTQPPVHTGGNQPSVTEPPRPIVTQSPDIGNNGDVIIDGVGGGGMVEE